MIFTQGNIYHVYNQGNNRQKIFFRKENYRYFREKLKTHILPYADVLAYCLMPNHFHLMVEVRQVELALPSILGVTPGEVPRSHPENCPSPLHPGSHPGNTPIRFQTFNTSIGIMLRSYTRAINLQEKRTGALFREETKAICLTETRLARDWYISEGITYLHVEIPDWQYPQTCYRYIINNPVAARLVNSPDKWPYSSASDLQNNQTDLVNRMRIEQLGLFSG